MGIAIILEQAFDQRRYQYMNGTTNQFMRVLVFSNHVRLAFLAAVYGRWQTLSPSISYIDHSQIRIRASNVKLTGCCGCAAEALRPR